MRTLNFRTLDEIECSLADAHVSRGLAHLGLQAVFVVEARQRRFVVDKPERPDAVEDGGPGRGARQPILEHEARPQVQGHGRAMRVGLPVFKEHDVPAFDAALIRRKEKKLQREVRIDVNKKPLQLKARFGAAIGIRLEADLDKSGKALARSHVFGRGEIPSAAFCDRLERGQELTRQARFRKQCIPKLLHGRRLEAAVGVGRRFDVPARVGEHKFVVEVL